MRRAAVAALAVTLGAPAIARADAPSVFGSGPRSAALASSDVAEPRPIEGPRQNAAATTELGLRLAVAYAYEHLGLRLDDRPANLDDASGITFAAQYAAAVAKGLVIGGGVSLYLPDRSLAQIAFRPATEPQLVMWGAALQRATFDAVVAVRYGKLAIGGGVAATIDASGATTFDLQQDAKGVHARADADVTLPMHLAPIVGLEWATEERVRVGATFRGPLSTDLALASADTIALASNPLDGSTTVRVGGVDGYEPARLALGTSVKALPWLTARLAFEYAVWGDARGPAAFAGLDLALATTPSQRVAAFLAPRYRDTITPKVGLEATQRWGKKRAVFERLGYAFVRSPVPPQLGLTSYVDADRHVLAAGVGATLGGALGAVWSVDAAAQVHLLETRVIEKTNPALPHARLEGGGQIGGGTLGLEAAFR